MHGRWGHGTRDDEASHLSCASRQGNINNLMLLSVAAVRQDHQSPSKSLLIHLLKDALFRFFFLLLPKSVAKRERFSELISNIHTFHILTRSYVWLSDIIFSGNERWIMKRSLHGYESTVLKSISGLHFYELGVCRDNGAITSAASRGTFWWTEFAQTDVSRLYYIMPVRCLVFWLCFRPRICYFSDIHMLYISSFKDYCLNNSRDQTESS